MVLTVSTLLKKGNECVGMSQDEVAGRSTRSKTKKEVHNPMLIQIKKVFG